MTVVQSEPMTGQDLMEGRCPKNPGPEHDHLDLTFDGKPRCTAHSKQAKRRCARARTPGTNVCKSHGSAAPQTKRKAALRLAAMVDPALDRLHQIVTNPDSDDGHAIRAVENVLDRTGYPRKVEYDPETATQLLIERLIQLRDEPEVIEGEVVEDG